jgi:hypothetical protein
MRRGRYSSSTSFPCRAIKTPWIRGTLSDSISVSLIIWMKRPMRLGSYVKWPPVRLPSYPPSALLTRTDIDPIK